MKERQKDLKFLSEEEYWKLQIFFANGICYVRLTTYFLYMTIALFSVFLFLKLYHSLSLSVIQALGEHLKLRQQVIATATVYFKRFYARYHVL